MNQQPDLISELSISKSVLGTDGIIKVLQEARAAETGHEHIIYVFNTVNETLSITVSVLEENNSRSDLRKIAIGFYWFFLTKIFDYSCSKIYKSLPAKVPQQMIFKYGQVIKKAKLDKPKTDLDRLIVVYFKKLDDHFKKYKKQLSNA